MTTDLMSPELEHAVRRLVNGFSFVPQEWVHKASLGMEGVDEIYSFPMWGTLFIVHDPCDRRKIESLMTHPVPTDAASLIEFAEDRGVSLDEDSEMELIALAASEDDEDAVDDLRRLVIDRWHDSGDEEAFLTDAGWLAVGDTGIVAMEWDDHLLLGINGAGYSFYDAHWRRLYAELGYKWHENKATGATSMTLKAPDCTCGAKMTAQQMRHEDYGDVIDYRCEDCNG